MNQSFYLVLTDLDTLELIGIVTGSVNKQLWDKFETMIGYHYGWNVESICITEDHDPIDIKCFGEYQIEAVLKNKETVSVLVRWSRII